jgi:hypothetical protein
MESLLRAKPIAVLAAALFFAAFAPAEYPLSGQTPPHFYNVDKETRIEGTVQDILMEPRYEARAPFLVVILEEKDTRRKISVEVSPAWFFKEDIHKGERLRVVGSVYGPGEGLVNVIAREVQCRGRTITVRDKRGFPTWSGGRRNRGGQGTGA